MVPAEVEASTSSDHPDVRTEGLSCAAKCGGGCCCIVWALLVAVYFLFVPLAGEGIAGIFLSMADERIKRYTDEGYDLSNMIYKTAWPLCGDWEEGETISRFDGGCGDECYNTGSLRDMQDSLEESQGQRVRYPSRAEDGVDTIQLGGWLIPAAGDLSNSSSAPRIVVQHGIGSNANYAGTMMAAYHLREMGFHVLLNNFRDHGYSEDSQAHLNEWGGGYTNDLLGAWDYLVNDPDGLVGGRISDDKVGIFGFSLGAFMTLNAFGREGRVPAAWADSPPHNPKKVFLDGASKAVPGAALLTWLFGDGLWQVILDISKSKGIDVEKNQPEKNLPMGPSSQRRLAMTTNPADDIVPFSDYELVRSLLEEHEDKYSVEHLLTDKTCGTYNHCVAILLEPDLYVEKLCTFFKTAFQQDAVSCSSSASDFAVRGSETFMF